MSDNNSTKYYHVLQAFNALYERGKTIPTVKDPVIYALRRTLRAFDIEARRAEDDLK